MCSKNDIVVFAWVGWLPPHDHMRYAHVRAHARVLPEIGCYKNQWTIPSMLHFEFATLNFNSNPVSFYSTLADLQHSGYIKLPLKSQPTPSYCRNNNYYWQRCRMHNVTPRKFSSSTLLMSLRGLTSETQLQQGTIRLTSLQTAACMHSRGSLPTMPLLHRRLRPAPVGVIWYY